ncbi:hypothetical protein TKK_0002506 [Trichogramma kaykai]
MTITGTTCITISINERTYSLPVCIAPTVTEPLVLGIPWIREEKAIIDAGRNVLHFGKTQRQTVPFLQFQATRITPAQPVQLTTGFPERLRKEVDELFAQHAHVLSPHPGSLTRTNSISHKITLKEDTTFRLPLYRYSEEKRQEIDRQVKEMLALDIIEPCISPYSSPIVLAKKRNGTWRFCVDYRKLNSLTEDTAQPIPRICDTLKDLGDSCVFSTLDLRSGYWQIPMDEKSKPLTAFATPSGGTYQFKVMPFGLKGAPGTFQRLISQEVLAGYMGDFCVGYLDDIIIHSRSYEEHLHHLSLVLERLSIHQLTCSPEKVHLGFPKLEFLGFNVTKDGNEAKEEYLREIQQVPPPTTIKQLQSFIGACNWLHEYIKDLAIALAPLTELLKKKTLKWTKEAQIAFEDVKKKFTGPLKLSRPSAGKRFILQTDASSLGMGAVLFQEKESQERSIIAYASAKFSEVERRYHCNEQECLAIIWAIKRFRHYLEDAPFTLRTDSKTLTWLHRFKETRDKLLRWSLLLQEFQFKIEHCPGKLNELPDLLSRNPIGSHTELENWDKMMPPDVTSQQQSTSPRLMLINITEPLVEKIKEEQQKDPAHAHIAKQCMLGRSRRYQIAEDGLWYFDQRQEKWKLSVPKDTKPRVLHDFHDAAGHPGEDETYRAIRDRFYWPNIKKSVRNHVKLCRICACGKKSKSSNTDIRPHQPKEPWSSIAVDFMGPYPITARRKRFILVVTDLFSRWTEAFPMVTSDTEKVIRIMEDEVFGRWGYPQSILSDNGPQFRSAKWQQACDKWQAKLYTTAIYSPRANPTERRNQEIKKGLRLHLMDQQQHQQWDLRLPQVLYDLRCRRNAATGQTPAYILFGKELNRPGDWKLTPNSSITDNWKERVEQTRKAQTRYQKKYATTETNKADYSLGDLVYTKAHHLSSAPDKWHAGFGKKWEGPFQVIAQVSEDVFILNKNESETKTHRSEIKPAETQGLEFPAATHSNSDSTTSPESPANTRSNADSTQGLEFPADTPSNIDSTPSPVPPANTRSNADSTQGLEFPADTPSPSPVPPANTCSNADSTTRSDTHPATPTLEEESKEDCSGEHGHRYNLRRRNK